MKKWLYVISVGSMTAIFLLLYLSDRKEADAREHERVAIAAKKQEEAAEKKKADELQARADAQKRAEQRAKEDADREAEKRAKWDAESKKIQDETNAALARGDKASKEASRLEIELDTLQKNREKQSRESFETSKRVERAEVERQAAEFEIQRLTEQIARRAADSSLTRMPAPVAAAPAR
ncbi:MAG TPA: hypothetical protein VHO24_10685 [Opitutaceae bacterium]|nr:hypothetical protein [Opitutaceae bacterium]